MQVPPASARKARDHIDGLRVSSKRRTSSGDNANPDALQVRYSSCATANQQNQLSESAVRVSSPYPKSELMLRGKCKGRRGLVVKAAGWLSLDRQFEPYLRANTVAPSWCGLGCRSRTLMVQYISPQFFLMGQSSEPAIRVSCRTAGSSRPSSWTQTSQALVRINSMSHLNRPVESAA